MDCKWGCVGAGEGWSLISGLYLAWVCQSLPRSVARLLAWLLGSHFTAASPSGAASCLSRGRQGNEGPAHVR
jgi:hypothetical protein